MKEPWVPMVGIVSYETKPPGWCPTRSNGDPISVFTPRKVQRAARESGWQDSTYEQTLIRLEDIRSPDGQFKPGKLS